MIAWLLCSCGSASGVPADANAEASVAEGVTSAPGLPVPTTTPEPIATATFPVTTVVAIASGGYEHTEVGAATTVAEPCPADWQPGADDHDKMQAEVERLEPMIGQVLAYGAGHPDEFGAYGLVWGHSPGDASVFISFTSDLDTHRHALRERVSYPDELLVCQVAVSADEAQALFDKLMNDLEGHFQSLSLGYFGGVEVLLLPGEQQLAEQLALDYGAAVTVTMCGDDVSCWTLPPAIPPPTEPPVTAPPKPRPLAPGEVGPQLVGEAFALGTNFPLAYVGNVALPSGSDGSTAGTLTTSEHTYLIWLLNLGHGTAVVLISEGEGEVAEGQTFPRVQRVLAGFDIALSDDEEIATYDCRLDGASPDGLLLSVVPAGIRGDVAATRAWTIDAATLTPIPVEVSRVACSFSLL
jgi:hypothetical protein